MQIRPYITADCAEMAALFYHTVHTVNARDYTKAQRDVWATGQVDTQAWDAAFLQNHTLVAQADGVIVGFADMQADGYLDRLYVHKDYQGRGIARALVKKLEQYARAQGVAVVCTYASITAKPFFEKQGYSTVCENKVVRGGVQLLNFKMEKHLTP